MKEKNKIIIYLIVFVLILLCGLYYVIFIYEWDTINDKEGSCNIDKPCDSLKIIYIKEEEKIKTYDDNYLIFPFINIDDLAIIEVNKKIEEKFNYYKDLYNKDNKNYKTEYKYFVDEEKKILSLLIVYCGEELDHTYGCDSMVYNIDLNSNRVLTNKELLHIYEKNISITETDKIYINDKKEIICVKINNLTNIEEKLLEE